MKPRPYTEEEIRNMFLSHMRSLVNYWNNESRCDAKEKLENLAFSILVCIDGGSMGLPHMDLVCRPHKDDKKFHQIRDENWIEDGTVLNKNNDFHDLFFKK